MLDISQVFELPDKNAWTNLAKSTIKNERDYNYSTKEGVSLGIDYDECAPLILNSYNTAPKLITDEEYQAQEYYDVFFMWEKSELSWEEFLKNIKEENILINSSRVHNAGGSIVQELEFIIALTLELAPLKPKALTIQLSTDSLYFCNIAKLRAIRFILESLKEKLEIPDFQILVESSLREHTQYDLHNNMLRGSLSMSSALNAGVDLVKPLAFDNLNSEVSALGKRQTENSFYVLTEESFLGGVKDPSAGSNTIENLTREFINLSFDQYKKLQAKGGLFSNIKKWSLEIELVAKKREEDILSQKDIIVGVNSFTNLEDSPTALDLVQESLYLPVRRPTEKLESLRLKLADNKLQIALISLVEEKAIAARLGFAKNILETLGANIKLLSLDEFNSSKDSFDVLAYCGEDENYNEEVCLAKGKINLLVTREIEFPKFEKLYKGQNIYSLFSSLLEEVQA